MMIIYDGLVVNDDYIWADTKCSEVSFPTPPATPRSPPRRLRCRPPLRPPRSSAAAPAVPRRRCRVERRVPTAPKRCICDGAAGDPGVFEGWVGRKKPGNLDRNGSFYTENSEKTAGNRSFYWKYSGKILEIDLFPESV